MAHTLINLVLKKTEIGVMISILPISVEYSFNEYFVT